MAASRSTRRRSGVALVARRPPATRLWSREAPVLPRTMASVSRGSRSWTASGRDASVPVTSRARFGDVSIA